MEVSHIVSFGPYRLDVGAERVWRGTQAVKLTPKALAALRLFLTRPGQVVTKEELFHTVWPDAVVSDDALTFCIQELRQALRDKAKRPRYIETVHRRGFRFLPTVTTAPTQRGAWSVEREASPLASVALRSSLDALRLVGREAELAHLHRWLDTALNGERQIVFVTGEPGIGKTTLIEAFLQSLKSKAQGQEESQKAKVKKQKSKIADPRPPTPDPWVCHGQCIEHYGAGEGYLPLLEALGRLCRESGGRRLIELLGQHAPTWLGQMPALLRTPEVEALRPRIQGATRERMLRELAEALEVVTAERPLVLCLEDLQWSDVSTLDFLSALARRQESCQLLVLGTYRPVDVFVRQHPLRAIKQELQLHGRCQELALDFLHEEEVSEYLAVRFPVGAQHAAPLQRLARGIYQRTDGNPLFMVNLVEHLLSQRVIQRIDEHWTVNTAEPTAAVPESLRQMVEQRLGHVPPSARAVLEVASVVGAEFSVATVAAGVEMAVEAVEEQCMELARQEQFLRASGTTTWPDGTVAARYRFHHALYQEVLYERLAMGRRQRLHQRLGERLEQAYGERAPEIATELAVHFEQGRDYARAGRYLQRAAENAVRKHAYPEAIALLTQGLALLQHLPQASARWRQEFALHMRLSPALMATKGYAAPEVEATLTRALALSRQIGDDRHVLRVLSSLLSFYVFRGNLQKARECGEQCLDMGRKLQSVGVLLSSHLLLAVALMSLGEFVAARLHLEEATPLYGLQPPDSRTFRGVDDPEVGYHLMAGLVLWFLGYPDQALRKSGEGLRLAHQLAYPLTLATAFHLTGMLHELRGEGEIVQERAEALIALATEQGTSPHRLAGGRILLGRTLAEQGDGEGGLAQVRHGLTILESAGSEILRSYALTMLAEVCHKMGQHEKGLAAVKDALVLVNTNGDRWYEAELYRLKGELLLNAEREMQNDERKTWKKGQIFSSLHHLSFIVHRSEEAEECFHKAIEIARQQQAKSLELRAVMSLAHLWQQQGKYHEAHQMLCEIYGWFTEGFATKDLQDAKALLAELAG